jgi:hypothetical protein
MAYSKARRLSDSISATGEVSAFVDGSITHADLHTDMDLTGKTVLVANASTGDSDTTAANTAFVQQEIAALVASAPGTLNTLNELAAALGDDASFSTTVTNSIALKAPLASPTFTGTVEIPNLTISSAQGSDGQVLTSTGSGIAWENVAAGYTDSDVETYLNTSEIYTDATNNRLGIGNNSPVGKLDVSVASNQRIRFDDFGSKSRISSRNDAATILPLLIDASDLILNSGSGGNVGIGYDNPQNNIHILGSTASPNVGITLQSDDTANAIANINLMSRLADNNNKTVEIRAYRGNLAILGDTNYGNVGIGTTTPAVSLDVGTKTDAIRVPNGTTAQRPTGVNGQIRYNTSINEMEGYINNSWNSFNLSFRANGGTETTATINGTTYKIHAFTSSGTFQVTAGSSQIDVLIVAGGGGGGGSTAGGGGAGGLIYQTGVLASSGSYTITIGAGGTGGRYADAGTPDNTNGSNTTAFSYTAIGGGYGYSGAVSGSRLANSGGSGGGGGAYNGNDITTSSGAAGTSGQGFAGGAGNDGGNWGGGGGGGATAVGGDMTGTRAGGAGSNQSGNFGTGYGASGVFAGGGGGGYTSNGITSGGAGGGGQGADGQFNTTTAGSANTGGGGGGGGYYQMGGGGAGGSGIVIIRYEV